jgi:hypothetical protein
MTTVSITLNAESLEADDLLAAADSMLSVRARLAALTDAGRGSFSPIRVNVAGAPLLSNESLERLKRISRDGRAVNVVVTVTTMSTDYQETT